MTTLIRTDRSELMDHETLTLKEVEAAIRFLDHVNRWFGGHSLFLNRLEAWMNRLPRNRAVSILDVGTGGGELPATLLQWAKRTGRRLRVVGLEKSPALAAVARRQLKNFPSLEIRTGDFFEENKTYDFVVSNLVLHHIPPAEQRAFLEHANRLAAQGILMGDLERSWPNYLAVSAASFIWGNRVVRNDGPLSVLRSLTLEEATDLVDASRLFYLSVQSEPWCRLSIGGLKS